MAFNGKSFKALENELKMLNRVWQDVTTANALVGYRHLINTAGHMEAVKWHNGASFIVYPALSTKKDCKPQVAKWSQQLF